MSHRLPAFGGEVRGKRCVHFARNSRLSILSSVVRDPSRVGNLCTDVVLVEFDAFSLNLVASFLRTGNGKNSNDFVGVTAVWLPRY